MLCCGGGVYIDASGGKTASSGSSKGKQKRKSKNYSYSDQLNDTQVKIMSEIDPFDTNQNLKK